MNPLAVLLSSMDQVTCTKEFYYEMRERYNDKLKAKDYDTEMAALFIYLNKHCFNGLYRVNQKGQFNVPWNQKEQVRSVDVENIKNISYYLKSVTITCQDFEASLETAKKGDFIYFDSPYAPLNPASFDSYTKEGFTEEEHRRLAKVFGELSERGYLDQYGTDSGIVPGLSSGRSGRAPGNQFRSQEAGREGSDYPELWGSHYRGGIEGANIYSMHKNH